ncbi:SIMPL domain-containing protein [Oceanomicrobium pacificus]|uniref:DUF541 domain-containing protein n=1 Tax=Oceanomicrobium pacificus TaxID=2692916 RepID=A0A6B0TTM2_9RHOB|nr:SIMPL domain-containing protein [Oceanomicrobium pacificus]MXU66129.1 DUF541 domain-containing protein [Oceanomicrobium pacificus]
MLRLSLALTALVTLWCPPAWADEIIRVEGVGVTRVAPDLARITLGVDTQAETAAAAMAGNNESMAQVMLTLTDAGVAKDDIQTERINLSQIYGPREPDSRGLPPVIGFAASNAVRVTLRDLDEVGGVLDAVSTGGANRIQSIGFDISDPGAAQNAARRDAVSDAMRRAALYAEAAGVTLGPVLKILEPVQSSGPMPLMMASRMADESGVPVAPGMVEIGATITMEFAIVPAAPQ